MIDDTVNEQKKQKLEEDYEKLKNNKFKQQQLASWRPQPTILSTTITFLIFGIIYLIIGSIVFVLSNKIEEKEIDYMKDCKINQSCVIKFSIDKKLTKPVMFSYELDGFYQNHRRYVKSRAEKQLEGNVVSKDDLQSSEECKPVTTNAEMGKIKSVSGRILPPHEPAIPCGLIANSFFNDTFKLKSTDKEIIINEKGIAWESDRKYKFKNIVDKNNNNNPDYWRDHQWIDMTDEHFIVWMRPAALPNFRKLWGVIDADLQGTYYLTIQNNYDTDQLFKGKKKVVFSSINILGGKNDFLAISYLVVGSICVVLSLGIWIGGKYMQSRDNQNNNIQSINIEH